MLVRLVEHRIRIQGLREFSVALLDSGSIPAFAQGELRIGSAIPGRRKIQAQALKSHLLCVQGMQKLMLNFNVRFAGVGGNAAA